MDDMHAVFYGRFQRTGNETTLYGIYIGGLGLSEKQADNIAMACVDAHPREIIIPRIVKMHTIESFPMILKRFETEVEEMGE